MPRSANIIKDREEYLTRFKIFLSHLDGFVNDLKGLSDYEQITADSEEALIGKMEALWHSALVLVFAFGISKPFVEYLQRFDPTLESLTHEERSKRISRILMTWSQRNPAMFQKLLVAHFDEIGIHELYTNELSKDDGKNYSKNLAADLSNTLNKFVPFIKENKDLDFVSATPSGYRATLASGVLGLTMCAIVGAGLAGAAIGTSAFTISILAGASAGSATSMALYYAKCAAVVTGIMFIVTGRGYQWGRQIQNEVVARKASALVFSGYSAECKTQKRLLENYDRLETEQIKIGRSVSGMQPT